MGVLNQREVEDLLVRLRSRSVPRRQAYDVAGNKIKFAVYEDDYVIEVPSDPDCLKAAGVIDALINTGAKA